MVDRKRRALLGRIAELGWFAQNGEVAATQSLAMLLEDTTLRGASIRYLEAVTGSDLGRITLFVPEVIHEDGGRPDLEGQDENGSPLLVIEAKFGAELHPGQLRSYLTNQRTRIPHEVRRAFVLLVPPTRVPEAERAMAAALGELRNQGFDVGRVGTAIVTWEEWIEVWETAADQSSASESIVRDLEQFRAMCGTLNGLVIPPLGRAALGPDWRDRLDDLTQIVDEVTRRLIPQGDRYPMADEAGYLSRRYFPGGDADPDTACSLGIGTRFADEGTSPFWLRYHRHTPGFSLVRARLNASRYRPQL